MVVDVEDASHTMGLCFPWGMMPELQVPAWYSYCICKNGSLTAKAAERLLARWVVRVVPWNIHALGQQMVNVVCKCLLLNLDQFNLTSIFEFSPPKQLILYGLNPGICWFSQQNSRFFVGCVSPQIKPRGINGINPTPGHANEALPKVFARFLHIGDHKEQGVSKVSNDRLVQVLG